MPIHIHIYMNDSLEHDYQPIKEIKFVVKNLSTKKTLNTNGFTVEFHQIFFSWKVSTISTQTLPKHFPNHDMMPALHRCKNQKI
jgi:hypothetical protein